MHRRLTIGRLTALAVLLLSAVALLGAGTVVGYAASGVEPLARDCEQSELPEHTGFQVAPACAETEFGEVSAQENNPQLLIVDAPDEVRPGQDIVLKVSTRNLIRDRFLAAGEGGYYLETSLLRDGIQRGHFHAACRPLASTRVAPQPERAPSFFAVEDGAGGQDPDTVTVTLPGLSDRGPAQCAAWAGDGSHRMPMMQFANQVPAFDAVRLDVRGAATQGQARNHGGH
jgi:hypothetical protein